MEVLNGFSNPCCFDGVIQSDAPLVLPDGVCEPVAIHVVEGSVQNDPLHAKSQPESLKVWGAVGVGIIDVEKLAGVLPPEVLKLNAAHPGVTREAFRLGSVKNDALYSCLFTMTAIRFSSGLTTVVKPRAVYGFSLASAYVHAIHEAALADKLAPTGAPFADQLGLVTDIHRAKTGFRDGLVGTHGTLWWDGLWGESPDVLKDLTGLPEVVTEGVDKVCQLRQKLAGSGPVKAFEDPFFDPLFDPFDPLKYSNGGGPDPFIQPRGWRMAEPGVTKFTDSSRWARLNKVSTGFGPRVHSSKAVATLSSPKPPGTPPWKLKPVVGKVIPGHGVIVPAPPPAPPAGEYNKKGTVYDALDNLPKGLPAATCAKLDAQSCYCKLPSPVFSFGAPEIAVDPNAALGGQLDLFKTFFAGKPAPKVVSRGLASLTEQVGGDASIETQFTKLQHDFIDPLIRPLSKPFSVTHHYRGQAWTPGDAKYKDPYKAGFYVSARDGEDWNIVTGTGFSALQAMGMQNLRTVTVWDANPGGTPMRAIANSRVALAKSGIPNGYAADVNTKVPGGTADYMEVALPVAQWKTSAATDFSQATDAVVSYHLTADKWNPGGDAWITNYGNETQFANRKAPPRPAGFAPNPANTLMPQFAPLTQAGLGDLGTFAGRLSRCKSPSSSVAFSEVYSPYSIDRHWPKVTDDVSFVGLYGKSTTDIGSSPSGRFYGDLTGKFVPGQPFPSDDVMHQGLDINWLYRDTDTWSHPDHSLAMKSVPERVCFGKTIVAFGQLTYPLDCSMWLFDNNGGCSEDSLNAGFCTLAEATANECKDYVEKKCGGTWGISYFCKLVAGNAAWLACAAAGSAATIAAVAASIGCATLAGTSCSVADMRFGHERNPEGKMFIEMEHMFGYLSPADSKWLCDGGATSECTFEDNDQDASDDEHNTYVQRNRFGQFARVQDKDLTPANGTHPFTLAPGIFGPLMSAYDGNVTSLRVSGVDYNSTSITPPTAVPFPDDPVGSSLAQQQSGLRVEFVGDGVVDCGHTPFAAEIHPPHTVVLHVSTPLRDSKRYSVLSVRRGWHADDIPIDMWAGPRSVVGTTPQGAVLSPVGGDVGSGLSCAGYPLSWPTRLRCSNPSPGAPAGSCNDHPAERRFLPRCGAQSAGGLVEVSWK